jgi:hypothetical protein
VIAFQSHFVLRDTLAYAGGLLAGSAAVLLGGYLSFAILFGARPAPSVSQPLAPPSSRRPHAPPEPKSPPPPDPGHA